MCTVCHHMIYRQTVVSYNRGKYTNASPDVIAKVTCNEFLHVSCDGKQWVCKTCDGALIRANIPLQAKANGLQLPSIPNELSTLSTLELRLISLRVPSMKMVVLPYGKQCYIHGPAVNVPSNVYTVVHCYHVYHQKLNWLPLSWNVNYVIRVTTCITI